MASSSGANAGAAGGDGQPPEFLKVLLTRGDVVTKRGEKGHQGYETTFRFSKNSHPPIIVIKIFDGYRQLKNKLETLCVGPNMAYNLTSEFPQSFTSSTFGMGLNEDQLRQRTNLLNKWVLELCESFHTLPPVAQSNIFTFFELDRDTPSNILARKLLTAGSVNVVKSSILATTTNRLTASNGDNNNNNNNNNTTRRQSSSSKDSTPNASNVAAPNGGVSKSQSTIITAADQNNSNLRRTSMTSFVNAHTHQSEDMHTLIEDKLEVFVAFGRMAPKSENDKKIHVTYETCVSSLATKTTLLSTVCAFDGYRQLYKDLLAAGCAPKSLDPFPPTYAQSSWGFALTKEQLAERCFGLSNWIGLVCKAYDSMPAPAQNTFHTFLGLDTANNRIHADIVTILNHGSVSADSPVLVAQAPALPLTQLQAHAQAQGQSQVQAQSQQAQQTQTVGVITRTIGAHIQPVRIFGDTLEVIVAMESVMGLSSTNDGVAVVYKTCIGLLKKNDSQYTNGVYAPFDSTKELQKPAAVSGLNANVLSLLHVTTRSFDEYKALKDELLKLDAGTGLQFGASYAKTRLGLQLTIDQLEERVSSLNKWMVGLLIQFPDMLPEAKRLIVNFLQPIDPQILNVLNAESNSNANNVSASGARGASVTGDDSDDGEDTDSTDKFDVSKNKLPAGLRGTAGTLTSFRDSNNSAGGAGGGGSRRGSVKGGTSVAGDISMYADVDAACVPVSIANTLQSTVFLGSLAPKFVGDKKMHLSYQTVIAPTAQYFERLQQTHNKTSNTQPTQPTTIPMASISALKVFDGYRQLYTKLTSLGIKADSIGAPFPPTYAQSALGMSLSKDQVQDRCTVLNAWMGAVLKQSREYSEECKAVLMDFFNLSVEEPSQVEMLKELGWISATAAAANSAAITAANTLTNTNTSTASDNNNKDSKDASKDANTDGTTNGENGVAPKSKRGSVLGIMGDASTADTQQQKPMVEAAYSVGHDNVPTSIGPLQVLVTLGYLAGKSESDKKLHQTYAVTLKLLTDPSAAAASAGANTHSETSSANTHVVARAFDGYRKLQEELVRLGVSGDIEFPKTYPKSKLGIALTKDEMADRVMVLNRWMGAVLRRYASYPQSCQLAISDFLEISVSENIGAVNILEILDKYGVQPSQSTTAQNTTTLLDDRGTIISIVNQNRNSTVSNSNTGSSSNMIGNEESMGIPEMKAAAGLQAPPTLLHNWLQCAVQICDGSKKGGSGAGGEKQQMFYMTTLRFREFGLTGPVTNVRKIVSYPFERYRALEQALATHGVGKDKPVCPLSVTFPDAQNMSVMFGLSTAQIITRCVRLHTWVCAVLGMFHRFPKAAQQEVIDLLQIDVDDPSEPINKVIVNILSEGPKTQDAEVMGRINAIYNPPPPPPPPATKHKRMLGGSGDGTGTDGVAPTGCCTIS